MLSNKPIFDVAVIGGGYSGILATMELVRRTVRPLRVALIESRMNLGRGIAYSTPISAHLLNVRAKRLSVVPEAPLDFYEWAQAHGEHQRAGIEVTPDAFLPRVWYGDYLQARYEALLRAHGERVKVEPFMSEALALDPGNSGHAPWRIALADKRRVPARQVVLALGNPPRREGDLPGLNPTDERIVHAWTLHLRQVPADAPVLIAGTGLSMIDSVQTLMTLGHRGPIHAVSRHGLLPRAHTEQHGRTDGLHAGSLRKLFAELRREVADDDWNARPWQIRMDAVRHQAQQVWADLGEADRARFLRHLRSHWDAFRHRAPPAAAEQIEALRRAGRLQVHAGRLNRIDASTTGLRATIALRRGGEHVVDAARIVNALGIETDARKVESPLVQYLLRRGTAAPGSCGLGFDTTEPGRLRSAGGAVWPTLYTLGTWRSGELYESVAAHEIKTQAEQLAVAVLAQREADRSNPTPSLPVAL